MTDKDYEVILHQDQGELDAAARLTALLKESPLPDGELLANLGLYLSSKNLSRLLFFYEMYKKVVDLHGVIFDFGTRWGQNAAVLSSLRGIFDDGDVMAAADIENGVHLASNTRIVHRHDRLGSVGDRRFDQRLIDVKCVLPDVNEDRLGTP